MKFLINNNIQQYRSSNIMFPYNNSHQQPAQPWNGAMLYYQPNINPYQSDEFLNKTFNFNQQYIAAFQTLPHELKLKFYLSVEEMKLLGYMNDRPGYQNILQQIARRRMIIKKPEAMQKKQDKQKESQLWGAKLENLCQDHLKKMQRENFLDDLPLSYSTNHNKNYKNIDFITNQTEIFNSIKDNQNFDWASPESVHQNVLQNQNNKYLNNLYGQHSGNSSSCIQTINEQIKKVTFKNKTDHEDQQQFDEFVEAKVQQIQKSSSMPIIEAKQFTRSSGLASYMSMNLAPQMEQPKQEHIDIWDLEVIQDEPDKLKKIILNNSNQNVSKHETLSPSFLTQQFIGGVSEANSMQKLSPSQLNQNLIKQKDYQTQLYQAASSHIIGQQEINRTSQKLFLKNSIISFNKNNLMESKNGELTDFQQKNEQTINQASETKNQNQDEFQWQQNGKIEELETVSPITNLVINPNAIQNNQNKVSQSQNGNQFNFFAAPQHQYPNIFYSDNTYESRQVSSNLENGYQQHNYSVPTLQTSFAVDLKGFENSYSLGNIVGNSLIEQNFNVQNLTSNIFGKKQKEDQVPMESSMLASSLLPGVDTQILESLKRFPSTQTIVATLKKKTFDFDRHFYKEAQQLISNLGYQNNPDYEYIREQGEICNQIFRLTEAYTAAVDQDKQNLVKENLNTCKILYAKLDTNKIISIVKKYIKMQGKGLSYQIGRLSLQAGVPKELLLKVIDNKNFNQIATLFYLMVFFGSIYSTSTLACQVIDYMQQIYAGMQKLGQQISELSPQRKKLIKQNQKFQIYRENLTQISTLIRRFVVLGSLCSKDELFYDMASIQTKIDHLPIDKQKQNQLQLIPNYYLTFFSAFACGNCNNIYTLHSQMEQFINQHPLCALCFQSLESERQDECGGAKRDDGKYYHFRCWNFKNQVIKFKTHQMSSTGIQ